MTCRSRGRARNSAISARDAEAVRALEQARGQLLLAVRARSRIARRFGRELTTSSSSRAAEEQRDAVVGGVAGRDRAVGDRLAADRQAGGLAVHVHRERALEEAEARATGRARPATT